MAVLYSQEFLHLGQTSGGAVIAGFLGVGHVVLGLGNVVPVQRIQGLSEMKLKYGQAGGGRTRQHLLYLVFGLMGIFTGF